MHKVFEPGILTLYATGKTTGLVVGIGEGCTYVSPVHEGYQIENGLHKVDIGGYDISSYLSRLLTHQGIHLPMYSGGRRDILYDIKEKCGVVVPEVKLMRSFRINKGYDKIAVAGILPFYDEANNSEMK
eukprot:UN33196